MHTLGAGSGKRGWGQREKESTIIRSSTGLYWVPLQYGKMSARQQRGQLAITAVMEEKRTADSRKTTSGTGSVHKGTWSVTGSTILGGEVEG